jgi:hypothetical protein
MEHLEGSGTPVIYIGRTFLKVKPVESVVCYFIVFLFSSASVVGKLAAGLQGNRYSDTRLG